MSAEKDVQHVLTPGAKDEVHYKSPSSQNSVGRRISWEQAIATVDGKEVTLEQAALAKDEPSEELQKNVMRRLFAAFDTSGKGSVSAESLEGLFEYLGRPLAGEDYAMLKQQMFASGAATVTFDEFWEQWKCAEEHIGHPTKESFAMVSAAFDVPFQQQQLIVTEHGNKFTPNFRVKYQFKNMETGVVRDVSPWHDIPLYVRGLVRTVEEGHTQNEFNFICEIPKWTRAKFEISTKDAYNPIKQDMKNGMPRFYKHGDMMFNYGAFPQTWESTEVVFSELPPSDRVQGDNDPLDCIEIGMVQLQTGAVKAVKVLGVLGMIDDGEMDWKVIVIACDDPSARFMEDIDDVPKHLPGCLDAIREWLRVYKVCQGGEANRFAFDGDFQDRDFAIRVINESHRMWSHLRTVRGATTV